MEAIIANLLVNDNLIVQKVSWFWYFVSTTPRALEEMSSKMYILIINFDIKFLID